ncbi:hypothetical protein QZH41_009016, partial [Actinostola sp. cb2023]
IVDDDHEFDNALDVVQARHNITLSTGKSLTRNRRFFGLFIFLVSLVITIVATIVETIYDIAGCCGLGFNYLCGFEADFNTRKTAVKTNSEKIDKKLEDALTKRDNLECLAEVLKSMWSSVTELVKLQEQLLGTIDPTFKNILLTKEKAIRDDLKDIDEQNQEADVSALFAKLDEADLALKLSLGWAAAAVPGIGVVAGKAYKAYKVNKAYKALKATKLEQILKASPKARKLIGFTEGTAKVFLKSTAIAKFSNKASSLLKGMKFFKAAGIAMSVLSIAMDLFNIISTFIACKEKSDNARKSCDKLKEAEAKVDETTRNVETFENTLKTGLEAKLLQELKNTEFLNALTHVKETIDGLPDSQGERQFDTAYCTRAIPEFIAEAKTSTNTEELKNSLLDIIDNCVDKLKYSYECLKARMNMNSKIINGCRAGEKSFDDLLRDAEVSWRTTLDECKNKGEPYTTKAMQKQSLVDASRVKGMEFYIDNCKMNDAIIVDDVCNGNAVDLTDAQVQQVRTDKCKGGKPPKLSTAVISDICLYKKGGIPASTIITFLRESVPDITVDDINGVECE